MDVTLRLVVVMEYCPHHLYMFNKYNVGRLFHHYLVSTTKEVVSETTNMTVKPTTHVIRPHSVSSS
jgi:hypothetical protein